MVENVNLTTQEQLSVADWIRSEFHSPYQEKALKSCKDEALGEDTLLTFDSWKCLELSIKQKLGIFTLKDWVMKHYSQDEHVRIFTYMSENNYDPELEVDKTDWLKIIRGYEQITCR